VVILALGLVTFVVGSAIAQERPPEPVPSETTKPPEEAAKRPGYVVGPGDVLRIVVWKEPDLTQDVTVRVDGIITIPLLGDVQAVGREPSELAASLTKEFERFIENPRVTVAVTLATSARIYVVGQMVKPGEFPLSGRMTVIQALALAGGFKEFAKPEGIVIVRRDQTVIPVNYKRIADGKDVAQNVLLAAGDTVVVP
jgi:polysaccharide export outer membrane protein